MVRLEELTLVHAPVQRCFDLARSMEVHWRETSIRESRLWRSREESPLDLSVWHSV